MYTKLKETNPDKYPSKIGSKWTDEEVIQLLKELKENKSNEEIAKDHSRTLGGITSRIKQIATDYYYNNDMEIDEIMKYTRLSRLEVIEAINKREKYNTYKKEQQEQRVKEKIQEKKQTPKIINDSECFTEKSELKEILILLKEINTNLKILVDKINK
jgi:hypothetical protein